MGIRAIEYRPWKGDRTPPNQRWLVISKHMFQKNIRAKAVIVLLILGMMFAHVFPIIGAAVAGAIWIAVAAPDSAPEVAAETAAE